MNDLIQNYENAVSRVAEAARAAGRAPESVRLLAVSKTFPAEDIETLYRAGVRAFGESRIPELEAKASVLPGDVEWHLIGQLQSNKVRRAVRVASVIHSVDSAALVERLDRIAGEEGKRPGILLEVNISGETSKSGMSVEAVEAAAELAARAEHLDFQGFMTVAPAGAASEELAAVFEGLRALRDRVAEKTGRALPVLSMGMSDDFGAAIAAGSTLVRIGTAIFGHRDYGKPLDKE